MKSKKIVISFLVILVVIVIFFLFNSNKKSDIIPLAKTTMTLSSPAFENGGFIPSIYTCRGEGNHPPLEIAGVPNKTISLALVLTDPDAVTRPEFIHWVIWNIDPKTREIGDVLPMETVEGENSVAQTGFIAPCPPSGTHRYYFKLYALDTKLELVEGSSKSELEKAIVGHIVEQTELMGRVKAE